MDKHQSLVTKQTSVCLEERIGEDRVRRWPSASWEKKPHQKWMLQSHWSEISSIQNSKKSNVSCLNYTGYGIVLWHPKLANTMIIHNPVLEYSGLNWMTRSIQERKKSWHLTRSSDVDNFQRQRFLNKADIRYFWIRALL